MCGVIKLPIDLCALGRNQNTIYLLKHYSIYTQSTSGESLANHIVHVTGFHVTVNL